jgi:predicted Zn-dependent protease
MDRASTLAKFVEKNPKDPFPRYALALEHKNHGRLDACLAAFEELMLAVPDYVATYLHYGNALVEAKRVDRAREVYQIGLEAAMRKGDMHAFGELQGALAALA